MYFKFIYREFCCDISISLLTLFQNFSYFSEYNAIDSKLDELNSALDFIEAQNDNIYSQLLSLLQSNREIREELAEQNSSGDEVQN